MQRLASRTISAPPHSALTKSRCFRLGGLRVFVNFRKLGNDRPGQLSGDLRQQPSRKEDTRWESRLRAAHGRWSARCNSNNREMLLEANWHLPSLPEAALSDKVALPEEDAFMNTDSFEPKHTTLGFVGLGNMGSRIVCRLLSSGYKISIYSRRPRYTEVLEKEGATPGRERCGTCAKIKRDSVVCYRRRHRPQRVHRARGRLSACQARNHRSGNEHNFTRHVARDRPARHRSGSSCLGRSDLRKHAGS